MHQRIADFVALLDRFGPRLGASGFSAAARELCDEIGLFDEARRSAQSAAAQSRKVEAIEALLKQLLSFESRPREAGEDPALLADYLTWLALDSREQDAGADEAVTLSTLHGAKGLEWRAVFLCGLEEGLLPHSGRGFEDASGQPVAAGAANLEEERRLCYVGITRAGERVRRGKPEPRTPSRFLDELPAALVDRIDLASGAQESGKDVQQAKAKNFFAAMDALLSDEPGN